MNPELIIFDCDGVLIDSELIACDADAIALTEAGYPVTRSDVVTRFAGIPAESMYAMIEEELGRPLPSDLDKQVKRIVLEKYRTELRAIDGVADVLSAIPKPKCVASSSNPERLALGLIETGLFELIYPHIYSTALVPRGKPHPDIFEYAAKQMGVRPSRCIVVEDSVAGVNAARAAGMKCIGFIGGSHVTAGHPERLIDAGADSVTDDFRCLLQLFG